MFKNLQMINEGLQDETKDDSEQMPIVAFPAQMPQNPLLPAALSTEYGNKLIAEFMKHLPQDEMVNEKRRELGVVEKNYHTSWDWLMPVIEKIHIDRKVKEVSIRPGRTRILLKEFSYIQSPCLPENNSITECWLAVIKFIIWHNQQGVSEGSR